MSTRTQQAVTYRNKRKTSRTLVYRNCVKLNAEKEFGRQRIQWLKDSLKVAISILRLGYIKSHQNNEKIKTLLNLDYTDQNSVPRPRLWSSQ